MPDRRSYFHPALLVLVGVNVLNFYDRNVSSALNEPIRREFLLSDAQMGLLHSAFIWVYALVGLPLGRLSDGGNRKLLLAGAVTIWSVMTACRGLVSSYAQLMTSTLGVAVGEAVCTPTASSWIGDLYTPERRSKAISFYMMGLPLGAAASLFLSGPIAQAYGWRWAMMAAALPAVLLVPALLMVEEPARERATEEHHSPWGLLRIPTMWWIILSGGLFNFIMYAVNGFVPALLSRVHGLSVSQAGWITGVAMLTGGVLGAFVAGPWGDHIIQQRRDGRMLWAAVTTLLAAPASWLMISPGAGQWVTAGLFVALTYALFNAYYGLVYPSLQDIVPPQLRATAMATYFLGMYICGGSFGPLITGRLSDTLAARAAGTGVITEAHRAVGLQQAMLVIPVIAVAMAVVLWAGSRTIRKDSLRQEK